MKKCTNCHIEKDTFCFSQARKPKGGLPTRGGLGVVAVCKYCIAEKRSPGIHKKREEKEIRRSSLLLKGLKECSSCDSVKVLNEFCKSKASVDGVNAKCRDCSKAYLKKYREENPDSFKEYYQENKESLNKKYREWRINNIDRRKIHNREYLKQNRGRVNYRIKKRYAQKRNAVPKWADLNAIDAIYKKAAEMKRLTGLRYEVDHIYPLQGKIVSGLHVENNLQILLKEDNIKKGNKMPEEFYANKVY